VRLQFLQKNFARCGSCWVSCNGKVRSERFSFGIAGVWSTLKLCIGGTKVGPTFSGYRLVVVFSGVYLALLHSALTLAVFGASRSAIGAHPRAVGLSGRSRGIS